MLNTSFHSSDYILSHIQKKNSAYWNKLQKKNSLALFHKVAVRVPAYKRFLKKYNINHELITSWDDFVTLPTINKKNYIRKYSLKDLCWDGSITKPMILTATSGSTGEPSYFLRQDLLDWQYSISIEKYMKYAINNPKKTTLVIICFGMGIWIGGLITYKAIEIASFRAKLPISIITPGINKKEIFTALKKLAPQYSQTLMIGYPPFIKDIIDESDNEGINIRKLNLRLIFAAETITEEVRDYMFEHAGISNIYTDFMNIYGSADIGAMAFEEATSILIRRLARNNQELFHDIFTPINKIPTLAQYNPMFVNFESIDSEIILTGDNAIPLIRYSIGDNGGVLPYTKVVDILSQYGIDLSQQAKKLGIQNFITQLPFVFIYERADFSVSLYGLNIYPEWIRKAIVSTELSAKLTSKFTLITKFNENGDQYLELNVELKKGAKASIEFKHKAEKLIVDYLSLSSSEYRELLHHLKKRAHPKLKFWRAEDPLYFQPGIKQKWVTS